MARMRCSSVRLSRAPSWSVSRAMTTPLFVIQRRWDRTLSWTGAVCRRGLPCGPRLPRLGWNFLRCTRCRNLASLQRQQDIFAGECMTRGGELNRRAFLVGAGGAGCGLALGFAIPTGARVAPAAEDPSEINCWVVIAPDDTVTIRTARAEMGQGALTGLAMLVAEELACDWAKVRTEFVSPTQNLLRARVWG